MLVSLAALMLLVACKPAATPSNTITGIVWEWVSVIKQTNTEKTTVPDSSDYTITFTANGTSMGKADFNNIAGT
jgi:heat shock protein HslJ